MKSKEHNSINFCDRFMGPGFGISCPLIDKQFEVCRNIPYLDELELTKPCSRTEL